MGRGTVHRRRWGTLVVLCLSLLIIGLDNTILNVALPTLQRDLDASTSQLQWIVDSYVLVFAGLLLTAGAIGDRFGRKGALNLGLVVFAVASVLSAYADSAGMLIATRALMGVGGAFIMPTTLSILTNVFTDPRERARAIAAWSGVAGLGIALGPVTGGWLLEHFWWGSVFLVNVVVVVVALAAGAVLVPTSRDDETPPLDLVGAALSVAGLTALVWAIIEAPISGWGSGPIVAGFAAAAVLLGAFLVWERRVAHPMLPLTFFSNPRFSAASVAVTLVFFGLFGSLFLLTQYLQSVLGYTALEAGVRLLPLALVLSVAAGASARLVERIGTKRVVALGLVLVASGLVLASTASAESGYGLVVSAMMIMAMGMGLTMAPSTESIMGSLPLGKAGVGSAVNDTTRQVGGALGVAVLGSIVSSGYRPDVTDRLAGSLPPEALEVVTDSVGGAVGVAARVGGPAGDVVAAVARTAFADAMGAALLVGAAVAFLGAVVALLWLPARAVEPGSAAGAHPGAASSARPAAA
ncbi:MAG TPA: MFS transporter [Acidimicrobiales bacterium]|jgi:EmrB/QacA subfamily drug resistance transporter